MLSDWTEEVLRSCAGTGYLVYRIGRGTGRGILAGKNRTNCATFVKASLRECVMDGCCMKTVQELEWMDPQLCWHFKHHSISSNLTTTTIENNTCKLSPVWTSKGPIETLSSFFSVHSSVRSEIFCKSIWAFTHHVTYLAAWAAEE